MATTGLPGVDAQVTPASASRKLQVKAGRPPGDTAVIITSLLDADLYKFTLMQAVLHQFPGARGAYRFRRCNPGINLAKARHA